MRLKVLQVGMGNNPGGVEAFVMNYYRELSDRVDFDFVSMYGSLAYEEEIRARGGRVFLVPNVKRDYFGYVRAMRALLQAGKYDVVHVNMLSAANILPLKLAKEAGVRQIAAHSHNASAPGLHRKVLHLWNRAKVRKYATVKVACSEKAGRWMFGDAAFDRGEVLLLFNAIDAERFLFSPEKRRTMRERLGLSDAFVVGHVGRFQAQKNHERILDIFRDISEKEPKARLLLVGGGELAGRIREKAEAAGLSDRVTFAGVCDNVEDYLSAMDVFLFPSLFEGMPFTLVEAQANGLPCVISDTITQEVVLDKNNVCSLSLEQGNEAWTAALLAAKKSENRTDVSAKKELLRAAHLDIHEEAGRLLELYQGLIR